MKRVYQVSGLAFLALSAWTMWEAQGLTYWTMLGPGPGFFPMWLGGGLGLLSILWLAQLSKMPAGPLDKGFLPDRQGALRLLYLLVSFVLFYLLVDVTGFRLTMLAFLLFLFIALGRQNLALTLVLSVVGSFGLFYLFDSYLQVHLPHPSIEFLANLGL